MSYLRTPEQRARQSQAIRSWQPWKKSTGPKSSAGKALVACNALKHGGRSADILAELKALRELLAQCSERLDGMRCAVRSQPLKGEILRV